MGERIVMLKMFLTSLFDSGFKFLQGWLDKRRSRKLERKNVELTITNETLREAVQRAQEKTQVERSVRKLSNDELSVRMRDTARRIRKSRKR